jgi:hypothetical protein
MTPCEICFLCGKPTFRGALCEECKANEMAQRTQRKPHVQDKIMKACTVIVVVGLAIIAYAVFFT